MSSLTMLHTTLLSDSYLIINKNILRALSGDIDAALMLSELLSKEKYFIETDIIKSGEPFYFTAASIESDIKMTRRRQESAIDTLITMGWISYNLLGFPKKRHFTIHHDRITRELINEGIKNQTKKSRNLKNKEEFYQALNNATTWQEFMQCGDNIDHRLLNTMWILKKRFSISWNGKNFSQLKYYLRARFRGKAFFDYSCFEKIPEKKNATVFYIIDELRRLEVPRIENAITDFESIKAKYE